MTEGTLTVTAGTSGATVGGSGTSSVTITGTIAQINALLNTNGTSTVSYIDDTDTPSASATLTLSINDNGNTGTGGPLTGSDTATINITAVDDAPVATITPTSYSRRPSRAASTSRTTGCRSAMSTRGSGTRDGDAVGDRRHAEGDGGTSGATVGGSGTSSVTITGTLAQINALLNTNGTSTVSYIDDTDTPAATVTLTLSINDNGNHRHRRAADRQRHGDDQHHGGERRAGGDDHADELQRDRAAEPQS